MTTGDAIDRKAIEAMLENTGGDPEFVAEIIEDYLADTVIRLDELVAALNAKDSVSAKRAAHTIKGSSSSFGASHFSALAAELEQLSLQSEFEPAAAQLPAFRLELERVTIGLHAEQSRLLEPD